MSKTSRRAEMIDLLAKQGVMAVSDMARQLNASMMTVRRDLMTLEQEGLIKKVHGGAMLIKKESEQPPFQDRIKTFREEKSKIGKAAADLIKDGSIVFFDAGTTPYSIVEHLNDDIEFTAITIGLMTAIALCEKPKVNVICIGGNVHHSSYSVMNYMAIETIKKFHADLAFISTEAVSIPEGTFDSQLPLIEIKRAVVDASKKVILIADHSKFESTSLCLSIRLDCIDTIITDDQLSPADARVIKEKGVELMIV
jgi:DeoR/GlpR family transcriptional regulator of sugar metabolism